MIYLDSSVALAFKRLFARFPDLQLAAPIETAPRLRFREVRRLHVTTH